MVLIAALGSEGWGVGGGVEQRKWARANWRQRKKRENRAKPSGRRKGKSEFPISHLPHSSPLTITLRIIHSHPLRLLFTPPNHHRSLIGSPRYTQL